MEKKIYDYKEVYSKTLEYFNGDELATNVWIGKYSLKELPIDKSINSVKADDMVYYEQSPIDMFHRLTSELHRTGLKYENPLTYDEIYELIEDFKYVVPQGRPMAGIGNDNDITSISNCFVVAYPGQDSYGTIARVDQEIMQISKRGGGIGTDLSGYRPANAKVKNAAMTSTGPVEICANRFSNTIREVGQNGRRGALMLSMDIEHPDAEKFIDAKMEEGKITGANVSVKISDKWMESFISKENAHNVDNEKLWKKIIHNAWKSAEPGILFWDTIIRESVPDCYSDFGFKSLSTNPCFRGDMKLLTIDGYKTFSELDGKTIEIIDSNGVLTDGHIWCTGEKDIYEIKIRGNESIFSTKNHIFKTIEGEEVEAQNLKGKRIKQYFELNNSENEYTKYGFIQGGGCVTRLNSEQHLGLEVNIGGNDDDVLELFKLERGEKNSRKFYVNGYNDILKTLEFDAKILPERNFPATFNSWALENKSQFLKGLFSANGSIIKKQRVSFKTACKSLSLELLDILKKEFDIDGYITTNKTKLVKFSNGEYQCKESYDVNICRFDSVLKFAKYISFIHKYKVDSLIDLIDAKSPLVISCKFKEIGKVYDFNLHGENHWGVVNSCISHNCGEIPLSNKDSCRLMLLNLYSYVKNPFTSQAELDLDLLRAHSRKIMKIMDNMIDLEIEKIDAIIKKVKADPEDEDTKAIELALWVEVKRIGLLGRRSGIGVTAEGDMLAALGYKYGTPEATNFSTEVHRVISTNVYIGSCDMVSLDNRPKFDVFNSELEKNNPFINRLISFGDKDSNELAIKIINGRRNIACLTIPPAGSTSIMTQTTSGIEPVYKPVYKRKRKIDKNSGIEPDFIDSTGDWFEEYTVVHHKFLVWFSIHRNITFDEARKSLNKMTENELGDLIKDSPYYGATSDDVNWAEKVRMQGSIQKFIDHSISATTNIPNETTEETVREIYETAWRSGCKGMTVYRDGSRDGVLTSAKPTKEHKHSHDLGTFPDKRPKSIKGKVVRFNNGGEKWVSVVGIINDKPYEIFTGLLGRLNIPQYVEEGVIVKNKEVVLELDDNSQEVEKVVSRYDFQYKSKTGEAVTVIGLSKIFKEEYWNYAKLISGLLRNNMPIEYVVKTIVSLNLGTQSINSWKNGVIRTLKKFIKDGTEVGEKCPECGGNLVRTNGCVSCLDCAWSKCD